MIKADNLDHPLQRKTHFFNMIPRSNPSRAQELNLGIFKNRDGLAMSVTKKTNQKINNARCVKNQELKYEVLIKQISILYLIEQTQYIPSDTQQKNHKNTSWKVIYNTQ